MANPYALSFDGTDDYVEIGNYQLSKFTVEAWFYRKGNASYDCVVGQGYGASNGRNFWIGGTKSADSIYFSMQSGSTYYSYNTTAGSLPLNTWTHIAMTYDGASFNCYINGSLSKSVSLSITPNTSARLATIGNTYAGGPHPCHGDIDEVRIWDYARTEKQIKQFMNEDVKPNEKGLLGLYKLDEGAGTTTKDETDNNDGAISGATWITGVVSMHKNRFLGISSLGEYEQYLKSSKDLIPQMTSNTSPEGVASASSEYSSNYQAWKAFDKDNTTVYSWISSNGVYTGWLQYDFGLENEKIVNEYHLTTRNSPHRGDPNDWTIEASRDGINYVTLHTVASETGWTSNETRKFEFENNLAFRYYRINVTDITLTGTGGNYVSIDGFKLISNRVIPKKITNTSPTESEFSNYGNYHVSELNPAYLSYEKHYLMDNGSTLGSGKTFKQPLDLSKYVVKKANLKP